MLQKATVHLPARRFSLSAYISFLLIAVALLTLLATIGSILAFLRPALVAQVSSGMETDVKTHVQVVDTYLSERLNDVETLSQAAPLRSLLNGNVNSEAAVSDIFFTTFHRDVAGYLSLSLLNTQGNVVLSYPTTPQHHGKYLIQPEALQQLQTTTKVVVSDVFYDPVANNPSVDLYARVLNDNFQALGTIRASLSLHRLWEPVDSEPQANGADSFAFVLDQHGMRIAYTNPDHSGFTRPQYLFKAVASLPTSFRQSIIDENLYGNDVAPVTSFSDTTLATMQNTTQAPPIFQFDPAGQSQTFEAARFTSTVVPWTYYLLKPLNTITGLADQQLLSVFLIVSVVLLLAMVIGVLAGRRIAMPILRSVASLRENSRTLKTLADAEQAIATEQSWMVEASQMALESIKYYTNATSMAARRLSVICTALRQNPNQFDAARLNRALHEMAEAAKYIELAIKHQSHANEKLESAVRVTTQAATQLTDGAKSTDEAAAQLEYVVQQLRAVVGERNNQSESLPGR